MRADNTTKWLAILKQWYLQNSLKLDLDKSEVLTIGTATQLQAATSTMSSVSVVGVNL